jgi:anti-sigma B factor antagonist
VIRVVAPTLINTMRGSDGAVVVEIRGEIDLASTDRLRRVLRDAARIRPTAVIVDLLYVTFIDSTGIGALAAGYNAARAYGVPFEVRQARPFILTQLRQTGLYEALVDGR